jgi:hypothetical protein
MAVKSHVSLRTRAGDGAAEARAELIVRHQQLRKQKHWAAGLEGLAQLKLRLVASGLVALRSALKNLRAYLLTRGTFHWQQETLLLELRKTRKELRKGVASSPAVQAWANGWQLSHLGRYVQDLYAPTPTPRN